MTKTQQSSGTFDASRLIDSTEESERATLESVRRFVDTVDGEVGSSRT